MIVGIRLHAYLCGGLDDELEKTYPQGRRGCASGCPSCKDDVPRYLDCSALQWALAMALPGGRKFLDVGPLRRLGIIDHSAEALEFVVLATITYNEIRFERAGRSELSWSERSANNRKVGGSSRRGTIGLCRPMLLPSPALPNARGARCASARQRNLGVHLRIIRVRGRAHWGSRR